MINLRRMGINRVTSLQGRNTNRDKRKIRSPNDKREGTNISDINQNKKR